MPYHHFRVPVEGGAGEDAFNAFLATHRVLGMDRRFVEAGADSFWAYQLHVAGSGESSPPPGVPRKPMVDYKEKLSEADYGFYLRLREWRKARAEAEGVDAFTIFTNAQLAAIVERRPGSAAALREIAGIGEGRVEKYGEAILKEVAGASGNGAEPPPSHADR
jgi:superfamily II DNA helicase RecQ